MYAKSPFVLFRNCQTKSVHISITVLSHLNRNSYVNTESKHLHQWFTKYFSNLLNESHSYFLHTVGVQPCRARRLCLLEVKCSCMKPKILGSILRHRVVNVLCWVPFSVFMFPRVIQLRLIRDFNKSQQSSKPHTDYYI